jgi:hypothetical protein
MAKRKKTNEAASPQSPNAATIFRLERALGDLRAVLQAIAVLQTELVGGENMREQRDAWRKLVETIQEEAQSAIAHADRIVSDRSNDPYHPT